MTISFFYGRERRTRHSNQNTLSWTSGIPLRVRGGRKKFSGLIVAVNRLSRADCDIIVDVRMKESVLGYIHLYQFARSFLIVQRQTLEKKGRVKMFEDVFLKAHICDVEHSPVNDVSEVEG